MTMIQTAEKIASSQFVWAILCFIIAVAFYKIMMHVNKKAEDQAKKYDRESKKREQELKDFYAEQRKEYKLDKKTAMERERQLMVHLERSNESQEKTANTLVKIEGSLHSLEKKMDSGFNDVWEHLNQIEKDNQK